jgi:hypothetical protein
MAHTPSGEVSCRPVLLYRIRQRYEVAADRYSYTSISIAAPWFSGLA